MTRRHVVVVAVAAAGIATGIELVGTPRRGVRGHPGGMSLPSTKFLRADLRQIFHRPIGLMLH
jgi:hypothetical protein